MATALSRSFRNREHAQRHALLAEAHARPIVPLRGWQHITHFALCADADQQEHEVAHLARLCRDCGVEPPEPTANHVFLATGKFRLRWERHTEFSGYTIFSNDTSAEAFAVHGTDAVPGDWIERLPGELLVACHLSIVGPEAVNESTANFDWLESHFDPQSLSGSRCAGGAATIWTDFKAGADGFTRFLVVDHGLAPAQAGRLTQRLIEIETYRLMSLLGLPVVKELMPDIRAMENTLGALTERMASIRDTTEEQDLLPQLSELSAQIERIIAQSKYRLDASAAYAALVWHRIAALREKRVEGIPTIQEFMARRLAPATDTCRAIAGRLDGLSDRVSRGTSLLRSRIDLALEAQNQDLLASMDRRARLQLRLQGTVEGLSVVVLSYYSVGLVHYFLQGLSAAGWHLPVPLLTGLSILVIVPIVAAGTFFIHHRIRHADEEHGTRLQRQQRRHS